MKRKPLKQPTPEQVRALRLEHDYSVQAFGQLVHASAAAVYAWEAGSRAIPLTAWELLLIFFGRADARTQTN